MNSIKTKQSIQTIKTKNSKENLTHFIKQQTIHSKENNKEYSSSSKANASVRAADNISNTAKATAYESGFRAKKYVKQKLNSIVQRSRLNVLQQSWILLFPKLLMYQKPKDMCRTKSMFQP